MTKEYVISLISNDSYYTIEDLRYNRKKGILLSKDEYNEFLEFKDDLVQESEYFKKLPLKTFNSRHCFFVNGKYLDFLKKEYLNMILTDEKENNSLIIDRNFDNILMANLYSEIEGTLSIENVSTTRKQIMEVHKKEVVTDQNEIIIKNMINAFRFIIDDKPQFSKENLLKLYNILSYKSLPDDLKIKKGQYYRDDKVFVGNFEGADYKIINECMDSLFEFVNNNSNIKEYNILLPFICQYYILYVHPYFDYNGRTARMVSFWLNYIYNIQYGAYFMSEAINNQKNKYYKAIVNTRTTNNDLTYFLGYILETSIQYILLYKNLENIKNMLLEIGDSITNTELNYLKKIIVHRPKDYFNYKMFIEYTNVVMTRQGALKILNKLVNYQVLEKTLNKKGETVFRINQEFISYTYNE